MSGSCIVCDASTNPAFRVLCDHCLRVYQAKIQVTDPELRTMVQKLVAAGYGIPDWLKGHIFDEMELESLQREARENAARESREKLEMQFDGNLDSLFEPRD
jgi:hypothetical protein